MELPVVGCLIFAFAFVLLIDQSYVRMQPQGSPVGPLTDRFFRDSGGQQQQSASAALSFRIIEQTKDGVCKLTVSLAHNGHQGTGFFALLDSGTRVYHALFTCNHLLNDDDLQSADFAFCVSNDMQTYQFHVFSSSFTDEKLDATVVLMTDEQVRRVQDLNFRFLHINYAVRKDDSVFLFEHPGNGNLKFAPGLVQQALLSEQWFYHNAETDFGSSGSPVANRNGEVVGIHCGYDRNSERNYAVRIKPIRDAALRVRIYI